jgi:hypothetical protein
LANKHESNAWLLDAPLRRGLAARQEGAGHPEPLAPSRMRIPRRKRKTELEKNGGAGVNTARRASMIGRI